MDDYTRGKYEGAKGGYAHSYLMLAATVRNIRKSGDERTYRSIRHAMNRMYALVRDYEDDLGVPDDVRMTASKRRRRVTSMPIDP